VVAGEPDFTATAGLVLVVVGVRPDTDLAVAAGVQTGVRGALRVDRHMRTNLPDVLAAGDRVETWHRLLGQPSYLPLGITANKQGRVAGETAVRLVVGGPGRRPGHAPGHPLARLGDPRRGPRTPRRPRGQPRMRRRDAIRLAAHDWIQQTRARPA
jgi:NADPH-dependent 2,4-dienoyl-CoA reductase/sulfur reductase-like enzyme